MDGRSGPRPPGGSGDSNGHLGTRTAGTDRPAPGGHADRLATRVEGPSAARQLRAPHRAVRVPRGAAPEPLPRSARAGDEPGAAPYTRRGGLARPITLTGR